MENTVYNHLLSQRFEVYVGILHASEVDFVAIRGDKQLYVQVTYLHGSEENIKREFGTLWSIPDNLPKYVVSMDPMSGDLTQYPGIRHIHLREFLTMDIV